MKKQIKLQLTSVALALTSMSAFAQPIAQNPAATATTTTESVTSKATGNSFEKEVTPLLREISRKKSQLELRRLDRELERIDEESLKAQLEMDSISNKGANIQELSSSNGKGVYNPYVQQPLPTPSVSSVSSSSGSGIKVLMIYGFENNLSAKIASGQQGGYVVKKGDVMPDGRLVSNITSNYVEVRSGKKKGKAEKIFVSSQFNSSASNDNGGMALGDRSSTSMASPQVQANERNIANIMQTLPSPGSPPGQMPR